MTPAPAPPAKPALSLVICTLNEAEAIGPVLRETHDALAGLAYEIVVVDDSADDATADVVRAHAAGNPRIRLVHRAGGSGLASAAIAGWDVAEGDILAIMDGDGQHDPRLLPALVRQLDAAGADIAIGSRYISEGPSGLSGSRRLGSQAATWATRLVLSAPVSDPMSGLFVLRRGWFERVRPRLSGVGFKILADLIASGRTPPKTVELRTALRARAGGSSKLDARVVLDLAALLVEKRSGGLIPCRFTLFALVGSTGVVVHLVVLGLVQAWGSLPFWTAQAAAILSAMTSNFFLNNALTFRDLRLTGRAAIVGLATFYLACLGGAMLNEAIGMAADRFGSHWAVAGAAGALVAAIWNYWSSTRATWRAASDADAPARQARPSGLLL